MDGANEVGRPEERIESLSAVLDNAPIGIIAFDDKGVVTLVNRYHIETFGRGTAEDYLGSICMTNDQMVGADIASSCKDLLTTGSPFELPDLHVRTHFTQRDAVVNATGVPLHRRGAVSGGVVLVEDVTERHISEQQLVRTERLDALSEMAIGMTRNFNNLMTIVLGSAQLLQMREERPDSIERRARIIGKTVGQAAGVVRRLRALTRTDPSGGSRALLDLSSTVEEALGFYGPVEGTRSGDGTQRVQINKRLDSDIEVHGDSSALRDVVTCLIDNAFDAMPDGGNLRIETRRRQIRAHLGAEDAEAHHSEGVLPGVTDLEAGRAGQPAPFPPGPDHAVAGDEGWAEIVVSDTGTGMTGEVLGRAFEPFFTTKNPQSERGMGLSAARHMVEQHGGRISIDSVVGRGTRVTVALPLDRRPRSQEQREPRTRETARREAPVRSSNLPGGVEEWADLLTAIVESAPIGIAMIDVAGSIIMANKSFRSCLGSDEPGPSAPSAGVFTPAGAIPVELSSRFHDVMETGSPVEIDRYLCDPPRPPGRRTILKICCRPLFDPSGRATGGIVLARDITEREGVFLRSVAAGRAEALSEMANNVAHNFNNLLAVIKGCADLIVLDRNDRNAVLEHAGMIVDTVRRTAQISRLIQSFTNCRDISGTSDTVLLGTVIDDALAASAQNLREIAGRTGCEARVRVNLQPGLAVRGSAPELREVLCSLIFNAAEAMAAGGTITISASRRTADSTTPGQGHSLAAGEWVDLVVSDTGEGMTEEVRERCLEPLFTTKGPNVGLGLGLSVAYGLVTRLGGNISVRSTPGKGSDFTVGLPSAPGP